MGKKVIAIRLLKAEPKMALPLFLEALLVPASNMESQ